MSRMHRDDDAYDLEPDHGTRGVPSSILLFGLLVLLLLFAAVGGGVWFIFTARQQAQIAVAMREEAIARQQAAAHEAAAEQAKRAAQKPAPIGRDDFKTRVLGKTPDEVVESVGKPDSDVTANPVIWVYLQRTLDPMSRKLDVLAKIQFEGGVVKSVSFE